ncbi:MAG: hypothetical protein IKT67_10725 [Lachnospiraceae bacterium]|nr:hypothetical protein [Lachnospiraceae bacterium]
MRKAERNEIKCREQDYKRIIAKCPKLYERIMNVAEQIKEDSVLDRVYMFVYIPMLEGFANWLLKQAVEKKIRRLYFLARDGYQSYLLASKMCEIYGIPVECRYLSCSRYAWRIPLYAIQKDMVYEYTCIGGIGVTFRKMMLRAGLSEEEGKQVAKCLGMEESYGVQLTYREIKELEKPLRRCEFFLEQVKKKAASMYDKTIGYLKQEGLMDEIPYAIVDSGWTGGMQKILRTLIKSAGKKEEIQGFYFGLYELPENVDSRMFHSYWFGPRKKIRAKVHFSNCLFESVLSAPEGMTESYSYKENRYIATKGVNAENINRELMERFEELLNCYMKEMDGHCKCFCDEEIDRHMLQRLIKLHMCKPTVEEAECFGSIEFSDDVLETQMQQIAQVYTEQELKRQGLFFRILSFLGVRGLEIKESAWLEGSIIRSRCKVHKYLLQTAMYKYLIYIRKLFGGML